MAVAGTNLAEEGGEASGGGGGWVRGDDLFAPHAVLVFNDSEGRLVPQLLLLSALYRQ